MALTVRELKPEDWPLIEELFGERGACGGCWCMFWRTPHGGKMWRDAVGETNHVAFRKLVKSGEANGILAFDGKKPIGWCAFGRRIDFPRTETMKAYARTDIEQVWSINCFFVLKDYRGSGVGELMGAAAVKAISKRKGKIAESYPVPLTKDGNKLPAAFVYTGPEAIFKKLGFKIVQRVSHSRPLYRLSLARAKKKGT
jgi:GNAT superfamily N-acetyltransferase